MLAGRRDPSRRVAIGHGSSRAHFLAIIFLAIGFLDSFRFLDRKKSMQLCFSIADRHFFLVGPVCLPRLELKQIIKVHHVKLILCNFELSALKYA